MNKVYLAHSSVLIENKVTYNRAKDYAMMCSNFGGARLVKVAATPKNKIPSSCQCIGMDTVTKPQIGTTEITHFWFAEEIPVPRPLPVLDLTIEAKLNSELYISTLLEVIPFSGDSRGEWEREATFWIKGKIASCFATPEEEEWYTTFRRVVIHFNFMPSALQLTVKITDKG